MRITIATEAIEESTAVFAVSFQDEEEQALVPNSITWKLTDSSGSVINSRSAVSATPASSIDIVLTGDDLALSEGFTGNAEQRYLTIYGTYNSNYGSNLNYNHQIKFPVANLVAIS